MATFLISGSRGTDDPTMATLPFMAAKTAKEQGHDVIVWLWNEAVTLGRKGTADHVHGVNLTPLKDLLAALETAGVQIWICGACGGTRRWPLVTPGTSRSRRLRINSGLPQWSRSLTMTISKAR